MSETCNHDCDNCAASCNEGTANFREAPHAQSRIKKVIGIVSGKGGVGKSMVTSLLAIQTRRNGSAVALLDADMTGPSIPKIFGIKGKATGDETGIFPGVSAGGVKVMSVNMLLEDETDPVIWRGPIIAGTVKQFWTDVIWGDVDYMFIDMPPGTGDVPLTVFQAIPIDGIVIVSSPQELVSMIVGKAVKMAKMMNVPILGMVENMSYIQCPDCDARIRPFGASKLSEQAKAFDIGVYSEMPIIPALAQQCDTGMLESFEGHYLDEIIKQIEQLLN